MNCFKLLHGSSYQSSSPLQDQLFMCWPQFALRECGSSADLRPAPAGTNPWPDSSRPPEGAYTSDSHFFWAQRKWRQGTGSSDRTWSMCTDALIHLIPEKPFDCWEMTHMWQSAGPPGPMPEEHMGQTQIAMLLVGHLVSGSSQSKFSEGLSKVAQQQKAEMSP